MGCLRLTKMVFGVLATTLEHTAVIQADGEDSSMYITVFPVLILGLLTLSEGFSGSLSSGCMNAIQQKE